MSEYKRYEVLLERISNCKVVLDAKNEEQALKEAEFLVRVRNGLNPVWKEGEFYAKDVEEYIGL